VAWRPNNNVTIYGGWKRGFISGGFNASGTVTSAALVPNNSYNQQVVEGFEVGAKTRLFGQKLQLNVAAYTYNISGLQVNASLPTSPPTQVVNNAAKARTRGIEADVNWRTPVKGLSINGAIAYNDARYKSFPLSPCYAGQTISMGCNLNLISGSYRNQDLSGAPLVRAPKWAGNIGFDYQHRLANSDVLALSMDGEYTSGFFTDTLNSPGGYQRGYWLLNGSIHYTMHNGLEFAVIGRNLTEKWYFQRSSAVAFSGGPSGTAGPSYRADQGATVSRGREVWLQITYHM
jgi:iron complex outermembrane receptor protein